MQQFQRMTPDMIKKNLATGKISEAENVDNRVEFKAQPDVVQNNIVTVDKLQKWYMKAIQQWLVKDLPSYVKWLQSYWMEVEWRKEAQQRLIQHQIKVDKQEKIKNAPWYKNIIWATADSTKWLADLALKWVSNLAEEVAIRTGNEDLAKRMDDAEKKTIEETGDVWQNEDSSALYKWTKFVTDVAQVASPAISSSFDDVAKYLANNADELATKLWISKLAVTRMAKKAWEYVAKSPTASAVVKWAYEWAKDTVLYDAIANSEVATPTEIWVWTVLWWTVAWVMNRRAQKAVTKVSDINSEEIAWKIVQWDKSSAQKAVKSLQQIDTTKVKTYQDLSKTLSERKKVVAEWVDEILDMSDEILTPSNSVTKTTVWNTTVESNYVDNAIKHLTELHTKLWDDIELARITEIAKKYTSEWLSLKEANNLARDYSRYLSSFSTKTGDPLTSVWAKALENTRKWLKQLTRDKLGALWEDAVQLDDAYHNLADTSMLIDKMDEKVNALWQKVEKRTFLQEVANKVWKWVDFISWWLPKEFVSSFLLKSNQWLKVFNSIDLEKNLAKNLKMLDKLESLSASEWTRKQFIKQFSDFISEIMKNAWAIWATKTNLWE